MTDGGAARHRRHPEANRILVLGLLSLGICPFLAPWTWRQGTRVVAEIDELDAADPAAVTVNRAAAHIGRWLAIVGTVLWGLAAAALLVLAVIGAIDAIA